MLGKRTFFDPRFGLPKTMEKNTTGEVASRVEVTHPPFFLLRFFYHLTARPRPGFVFGRMVGPTSPDNACQLTTDFLVLQSLDDDSGFFLDERTFFSSIVRTIRAEGLFESRVRDVRTLTPIAKKSPPFRQGSIALFLRRVRSLGVAVGVLFPTPATGRITLSGASQNLSL